MKTIIIYATKYQSTKNAAEQLAKYIEGECDVINISQSAVPNLDDYSAVVLGSSIRMGLVNKKIRQFAESHLPELKSKTVAVFLTGGSDESVQDCYKKNFSAEFITKSRDCVYAGGVIDPSLYKGFDKFIVSMVSKSENSGLSSPGILPENLKNLAAVINSSGE